MIDELERGVRTVKEELTGERQVSRYMVEEAARNSEVLHAVRSEMATLRVDISAVNARMDVLGADMASVKAVLVMHGRVLDVLGQDVRELRGEMMELRQSVDTGFDAMERVMNERFDATMDAIRVLTPREPSGR